MSDIFFPSGFRIELKTQTSLRQIPASFLQSVQLETENPASDSQRLLSIVSWGPAARINADLCLNYSKVQEK